MTAQPHDEEGGALLWAPEGNLTIRKTTSGYQVMATSYGKDDTASVVFSAHADDVKEFVTKLRSLRGAYE